MKKQALILSIIILSTSLILISCNGNGKKAETPVEKVVKDQYQCPMKCTEQLFDKPGKCPVCDMELIKVTKS